MSRMYDNKPLENLPVHSVTWNGLWDHDNQLTQSKSGNPGILLEGVIKGKARLSVTGSQNEKGAKTRYFVLYTKVERAHKRKFDSDGKEIEPNFSETTKVSTGYLNSSYDVKAKGNTDRLSADDVKTSLELSPVNDLLHNVPQGPSDSVALFVREEDVDKLDFPVEAAIRVKTVGSSPFIESIVVKDDTSTARGNFTGGDTMGENWTDKIMALKVSGTDKTEEPAEVADDEWDD